MDNELFISESDPIDSMELLTRFTEISKSKAEKCPNKSSIITSIDIITAVYYFRKYPDVNEFINKFLNSSKDYFLLQWVRATWESFAKMNDVEVSELVIGQIDLVTNHIEV